MKEVLQLEFQLFLLALGRLTRFPIPSELPSSDDLDIRALRYYSLVGALVGLWGACALWGAALFLPPFPALLISLIATLMITAAFHELGLAEVSEALGRGRCKPDVLDALQKPPGLFGALVLGMVLMLKLSLLASLPVADAGLALIVGLTLGQMASVHVVGTTPQGPPYRHARRCAIRDTRWVSDCAGRGRSSAEPDCHSLGADGGFVWFLGQCWSGSGLSQSLSCPSCAAIPVPALAACSSLRSLAFILGCWSGCDHTAGSCWVAQ